MKFKYVYHMAYSFFAKNGDNGAGCCTHYRCDALDTGEKITEWCRNTAKQNNWESTVLINFIRIKA